MLANSQNRVDLLPIVRFIGKRSQGSCGVVQNGFNVIRNAFLGSRMSSVVVAESGTYRKKSRGLLEEMQRRSNMLITHKPIKVSLLRIDL
jgi:hypothetical protein